MIDEKLKNVLQKPGVYLLKNKEGKVLYVGKAKRLRNRLLSHFHPGKDEEKRHHALMLKVRDFETIVTDSEVEALILEANMVKEHRPRYNVNLKDDKSYPYIRVTNESFPRIFVTRKIVRDGSRYFGPYTDVGSLRQLMNAVRRIFPIRTCQLTINEMSIQQKKHKVCLNFHIGRCKGPCENIISREDYQWNVDQVVAFIKGKDKKLLQDIQSRMQKLAENKEFEEAARLRDQIRSITNFHARQKVADSSLADRDLLALAVGESDACAVVFQVREGKIINRLHYYLSEVSDKNPKEILTAFVKHYFVLTEDIPQAVLLSHEIEDVLEFESWLSRKRGKAVKLIFPQRGEKARLMDLCIRNADLLLNELAIQKMEKKDRIAYSIQTLQKDLQLVTIPHRIEAYDISNLSGQDAVASLVVFENGNPRKSEYRKFKIKTVPGINDFAMIAEAVERRISRLQKEEKPMPDLILVDGGKGQLSAAVSVLEKLNVTNLPIIGLAKRLEEIFVPGISDPQNIPKFSSSLRLLQSIRDEAHRFAVTYHRQRRQKRILHSELDDIPGIGDIRRINLIKHFGSLDAIRKASSEEIAHVQGMNKKLAERVMNALKGKSI